MSQAWAAGARAGAGVLALGAGLSGFVQARKGEGPTGREWRNWGRLRRQLRQWLTAVDVSVGSAPPGLCTGRDPRYAN